MEERKKVKEEKSVRANTIDLSLYYVEYALGSDIKCVLRCFCKGLFYVCVLEDQEADLCNLTE